MEQTARHDVRRLVAVLIAPAAIPAWRSYRAVCAAVAVGVCWRSSMPDAIRATSRNRRRVGRVWLSLTALSGRCRYVARPSALTPPGAPVLPRTDY